MKKAKIILLTIISFFAAGAFAQTERNSIQRGSEHFERGNYIEAEVSFREALEKNRRSIPANFNLGNALYRQGKLEEARIQYQIALGLAHNNENFQAQAHHNIGNTFMREGNFYQSVQSYRRSLRLNPSDEETRYNLALANALLRQQEENQAQASGGNESEEQANQELNPLQQDENIISRENAQQILDAFAEDERELLRRLNERRNQGNRRTLEKDW